MPWQQLRRLRVFKIQQHTSEVLSNGYKIFLLGFKTIQESARAGP